MNQEYNLIITIDLRDFCIKDGLEYRNKISDKIESYLYADGNGQWSGAGWFQNSGDIEFTGIMDLTKAEKKITEVLDEFDALDKLIEVRFYYYNEELESEE